MSVAPPAPTPSRRDELLQVALDVLERDGVAHLSIGEVARRAGIKPPSLYKQFTGKADIELRLMAHGLELLAEIVRGELGAVAPDATYRVRVARLVAAFRAFGLAHPQLYLLMNSRPFPAEVLGAAEAQEAARLFIDTLGGQAGVAASIWAWAHGIMSLEIVGGGGDPDASWVLLVDWVAAQRENGVTVSERSEDAGG